MKSQRDARNYEGVRNPRDQVIVIDHGSIVRNSEQSETRGTLPPGWPGFVTLDVMLSIIPMILILMYGLNTITYLKQGTENNLLEKQQLDKLYLISEQSVKQKITMKIKNINFENWIDPSKMQNENKGIRIGFEPKWNNCIYRVVAYGEMKEIKKIYFCF